MTSLSTRTRLGGPRLLGLMAGATLVAMASGCGGSGDDVGVTDPGGGGTSASSSQTKLTIVVKEESKTSTYTLTCAPDGAGGTHPEPSAACAALAKGADSLKPVAPDMICTQIYGGPETATITGTYLGQPVSSTFNRTNGCEIGRWKALEGLLPKAPASAASPMTTNDPQ